ncbi:LysE family translocator [Aquisediminimonas profunda]|uniref:LysE family translocator n=1 Tax=Aquisediminimonas profunda TaxID=1550733 RepID=UPI001FE406B2|nr:LysE family translocator [Aquisediminimonas profunda]
MNFSHDLADDFSFFKEVTTDERAAHLQLVERTAMEQFFIILGIIWLAVISPGADFALVSRVSSIQGRRAGIIVAFGIAIACWFHIAYAVFGLAMVEHWIPNFLDFIKIAGAGYLIYLGVSTAIAPPLTLSADTLEAGGGQAGTLFRGILTNALNPKTSIFVVSLYAQAMGPNTPVSTKLGYGFAISISHLIWFGGVSIFLSRPAIRKLVMTHQQTVNGVIGCILVLFGLLLSTADLSTNA